MTNSLLQKLPGLVAGIANFFIPKSPSSAPSSQNFSEISSAVVIPTYKPTSTTYDLVSLINKFHPEVTIVIVDDCTPENSETISQLKTLSSTNQKINYIRTPINTLKAGALNYGIKYLLNTPQQPQVIFTFDDDVKIEAQTLPKMTEILFSEENIGAVCSLAIAENKNANLLTRLQALEYHSFNISKIADNGFLMGPLVMQGMLTAFRTTAITQVDGYTIGHLIEDYDITAKLKAAGWYVKIAHQAKAWTKVPESLEELWKQRVRWSYGGLRVLSDFWRRPVIIFQDFLGHTVFISLLSLIAISFILSRNAPHNSGLVALLETLAALNFTMAFSFNLLTLINLPNRDYKDFIIRVSLLPEFIYCNILSLILMGSYLFFTFNKIAQFIAEKINLYQWTMKLFQRIGYSSTWGTK